MNEVWVFKFRVLLTLIGGNHVLAQIFKDNHRDWREESRVCWAMGGKFIFSCIILCDVNASHTSNFFIRSHAGRFWIKVKDWWGRQNSRIMLLVFLCILFHTSTNSNNWLVNYIIFHIINSLFISWKRIERSVSRLLQAVSKCTFIMIEYNIILQIITVNS